MAGVAEESRRRVARALCLVGIGLILAGAALIVLNQADLAVRRQPETARSTDQKYVDAQRTKAVLFWLIVLVGIFGLSTLAFLRWSRRFRRWVLHQPHPPTPADDIWMMHRLPDEPPEPAEPEYGD